MLRSARGPRARLALVGALLLATAAPAGAQEPVTLAGVVVDAEVGTPVVGALVTLVPGGRQAISDEHGAFRVEELAPGAYDLTVRAFGYRELTQAVTAAAGRAPLRISLAPSPVDIAGLTVRGDEEVALIGIVRNARTGDPIPWVSLWVTPDAQRQVAAGASGADGVFTIDEVRVGTYLLGARLAGYVPQFTQVTALPGAAPAEVLLEPDSLVQAGIAVMKDEMYTRRNAFSGIARAFGPDELNRSGYRRAHDFLVRDTFLSSLVPCERTLGMCVMNGGRPVQAALIMDDWQVCGLSALDVLYAYHPSELYMVEVFRGRVVIVRAYTHQYMEREGRRQGLDPSRLPETLGCLGDGGLEAPPRPPPPRLPGGPPGGPLEGS
jgi:hypothetical protein